MYLVKKEIKLPDRSGEEKTSKTQTETQQLWENYCATGSIRSKQELITKYFGMVKYVVRKMIKNYPQAIEEQDLYHIGVIGLVEAITRFDPNYGTKFESYAIPRIKGSIIDELRKLDWVPRSIRSNSNQLKEKKAELEQKSCGSLMDTDIASGLGIELGDLYNWEKESNNSLILSLDKKMYEDSNKNFYSLIEEDDVPNWDIQMEEDERKIILLRVIKKIPVRARITISLYYWEKLTFKEIGKILGLGESSICQIHSKTILEIKGKIREEYSYKLTRR